MTDKVIETTQAKQVQFCRGLDGKYDCLASGDRSGSYVPASDYERLQAEIERLRAGNFTPEEFQALCHNLPEDCTAEAFCEGCEDYQAKLFGQSPIAALRDRAAAAEAKVKDLHKHRRWNTVLNEGGVLSLCTGDHDKNADCEYEKFYPESSLQSSESARQAAEAKAREFALLIFASFGVLDDGDSNWFFFHNLPPSVIKTADYLVGIGRAEKHPEYCQYRLLPQESEVKDNG